MIDIRYVNAVDRLYYFCSQTTKSEDCRADPEYEHAVTELKAVLRERDSDISTYLALTDSDIKYIAEKAYKNG